MKGAEIQPGLWLDPRRAVFFAEHGVLVVADLHWGYAASHRAAGNLLPAWGDEAIARDLRGLLADYQPAEMLWLGRYIPSFDHLIPPDATWENTRYAAMAIKKLCYKR